MQCASNTNNTVLFLCVPCCKQGRIFTLLLRFHWGATLMQCASNTHNTVLFLSVACCCCQQGRKFTVLLRFHWGVTLLRMNEWCRRYSRFVTWRDSVFHVWSTVTGWVIWYERLMVTTKYGTHKKVPGQNGVLVVSDYNVSVRGEYVQWFYP